MAAVDRRRDHLFSFFEDILGILSATVVESKWLFGKTRWNHMASRRSCLL